MRTHTLRPTPATVRDDAADSGAIPWDNPPSLADTLSLRLVTAGGLRFVDLDLSDGDRRGADSGYRQPAGWDNTMPAALEPEVPPEPFREAFAGLSMREVREPDVFRHFFGGLHSARVQAPRG